MAPYLGSCAVPTSDGPLGKPLPSHHHSCLALALIPHVAGCSHLFYVISASPLPSKLHPASLYNPSPAHMVPFSVAMQGRKWSCHSRPPPPAPFLHCSCPHPHLCTCGSSRSSSDFPPGLPWVLTAPFSGPCNLCTRVARLRPRMSTGSFCEWRQSSQPCCAPSAQVIGLPMTCPHSLLL